MLSRVRSALASAFSRRVGFAHLSLLLVIIAGTIPMTTNGSGAQIEIECPRLIVPLHTRDTAVWDQALASDLPAGTIFVFNPGGSAIPEDTFARGRGGPGEARDPALAKSIRAAQLRGIDVIGYVRTGATGSNSGPRRTMDWVETDIRNLDEWYGVDGIFYDEIYADSDYLAYYQELVALGRTIVPGGIHMLHSGVVLYQEYATLGDITGVFEGDLEAFTMFDEMEPTSDDSSRWAVFVMSVTDESSIPAVIAQARQVGVDFLYATNRFGTSTENPWLDLPPYWDALVEAVNAC